ncbi:hypothetical protein GNIT_1639 [Glaciecola nitratireducens FR1064]|uniref:Uncharacterized protein n=1 Tax=Glaciecola nitratireducens (strain JCM 12485 / KCTC 12276 / FR1064) TaxID=1085623 RepID=G4QHC5_GLANF|nr:hypothetical protein GNIT_1639 [Glaciecola nitratireducens FR1064]
MPLPKKTIQQYIHLTMAGNKVGFGIDIERFIDSCPISIVQ